MLLELKKLINAIIEPLTGKTIEALGLTIDIQQNDKPGNINLNLQAGFPIDGLKQSLLSILTKALQHNYPSYNFTIAIDSFIKAHRTQLVGQALKGVKNTIAIASGKGGVGKSTVTVNLAAALAKAGAKVGILDADIYGPSIPLMLGKHNPVEVYNDRYLPIQAHGLKAMSIGYLMEEDKALIWRGPMLAKSLIQMLDITQWDELDYLFIDLPPGTGDIQLSLVQKIPLTAAVVITTPQIVATLDARKAIKMFNATNINVLGIVENMSTHVCNQCGHENTLFGKGGGNELSQQFELPLLGQLPLNAEIGYASDQGIPIATQDNELSQSFMNTALNLATQLAKQPLNYAGKFPPVTVV